TVTGNVGGISPNRTLSFSFAPALTLLDGASVDLTLGAQLMLATPATPDNSSFTNLSLGTNGVSLTSGGSSLVAQPNLVRSTPISYRVLAVRYVVDTPPPAAAVVGQPFSFVVSA